MLELGLGTAQGEPLGRRLRVGEARSPSGLEDTRTRGGRGRGAPTAGGVSGPQGSAVRAGRWSATEPPGRVHCRRTSLDLETFPFPSEKPPACVQLFGKSVTTAGWARVKAAWASVPHTGGGTGRTRHMLAELPSGLSSEPPGLAPPGIIRPTGTRPLLSGEALGPALGIRRGQRPLQWPPTAKPGPHRGLVLVQRDWAGDPGH